MEQRYARILGIIIVPITVYLLSFGIVVFNYPAYEKLILEYSADKTAAAKQTKNLIEYFQGKKELQGFAEKEAEHLRDVRQVIWLLLAVLVVCIILLLLIHDKKAMIYGGIVSLILPLILSIVQFPALFDCFHRIFFAQGTWAFSHDSLLIQMYPISFFHSFFKNILARGFILALVVTAVLSIDTIKNKLYFLLQQN